MATQIGSCSCGYPLTAKYTGQKVSCPYCHSINEAMISQGVNIPTWLVAGGIGLFIGIATARRQYKCLACGAEAPPGVAMCNKCFEQYRKDATFRKEYHRKHPRSEEE